MRPSTTVATARPCSSRPAYGVFRPDGGFANRGTFLVDRDGIVRFAEMTGPGQSRDPQAWRDAIAALPGAATA